MVSGIAGMLSAAGARLAAARRRGAAARRSVVVVEAAARRLEVAPSAALRRAVPRAFLTFVAARRALGPGRAGVAAPARPRGPPPGPGPPAAPGACLRGPS